MSAFKKIVIVGGGYAGTLCAVRLSKLIGNKKRARITLINDSPRIDLGNEVYRCLRNGKNYSLSLEKICEKNKIDFIEGRLSAVYPHKKRIALHAWNVSDMDYDWLVVATGLVPKQPDVAGLEHHLFPSEGSEKKVFFMHTQLDAQFLRNVLAQKNWMLGNDNNPRKHDFFVVVLGAGPNGLQIAGELAYLRQDARKNRIILIDKKKELLEDFSPVARKILKSNLKRLDIETVLGSPAISISDRALHIKNGQIIPWDLLILCAGRRVNKEPLLGFGDALSDKGLAVNPQCEIRGWEDHFAIGDVAHISQRHHQLGNALDAPKGALFAEQEAEYLADMLAYKLTTQKTFSQPLELNDLACLVSLGPFNGVGRIGQGRQSKMGRLLSPFIFGPAVNQLKKLYYWNFRRKLGFF